jgi:hypothetical protein
MALSGKIFLTLARAIFQKILLLLALNADQVHAAFP